MSSDNDENETIRVNGCVKWFNTKAGYGFITASQGERRGQDVFVHHTGIETGDNQYKYLVQGEHVEFNWCTTDDDHKWIANGVRGVSGCSLMCETRNKVKNERASGERSANTKRQHRTTKTMRDDDGVEWLLIRRKENGR